MSKHSTQTSACKKESILSYDITMRHIVTVWDSVKKRDANKKKTHTQKRRLIWFLVYANKVAYGVNIIL